MSYLVLGATGLQGGSVAQHLLSRGEKVRALTRNPGSAPARALAAQGVEVVAGDLTSPSSLSRPFSGIRSVFSVQDFYAPGVGMIGEIAQGRAVIAAAKAAGVEHVVQSTMGDRESPQGPDHFLSKAVIERELKQSGLRWTMLGTVWFLDNLRNPAMKPGLTFPILAGSLRADVRFPMLAVDDLGWVAAEALTNPQRWQNTKINLAGDALTVDEMKATYQQITGRKPKSWRIPAFVMRRIAPEFSQQLAWHNHVNFSFGSEALRRVRPTASNLATFLRQMPDLLL
jgi:uncharacterized protein YbjT (DUF2867 family)